MQLLERHIEFSALKREGRGQIPLWYLKETYHVSFLLAYAL
jgi:hypothetical protein